VAVRRVVVRVAGWAARVALRRPAALVVRLALALVARVDLAARVLAFVVREPALVARRDVAAAGRRLVVVRRRGVRLGASALLPLVALVPLTSVEVSLKTVLLGRKPFKLRTTPAAARLSAKVSDARSSLPVLDVNVTRNFPLRAFDTFTVAVMLLLLWLGKHGKSTGKRRLIEIGNL
jgi:hypothetical protein